MSLLSDKAIFISGAGSGIGRAAALAAVEQGARLALADKDGALLEETAGHIRERSGPGARVQFYVFDTRHESGWQQAINATLQHYGRLDGLANCAGSMSTGTVRRLSLPEFQEALALNLESTFLGMKYAHQAMKSNPAGGAIINLSSTLGQRALPDYTAYSAAMGGCRLMTKAAAIEFGMAGTNIRVNSVHPGNIEHGEAYSGLTTPQNDSIPLARMGDPREVADTIIFLLSDGAAFMTGSEVTVDGGRNCRIHESATGAHTS